jgi:hypothetical protein
MHGCTHPLVIIATAYSQIIIIISIKVVPEQSRKDEYERERLGLLGIAKKINEFLAIPSKPFVLK